jgi:hypothetical protein
VVRALALAIAIAGAAGAVPARADSPKLAEAREAIDGVRYDRARTLLLDALREGTNSPPAMAELYRLSASTAIVLGDRDLAEQYYRRWLALDPSAALPDDIAPKLREPFVAAQAYMAAHGKLAATARVANDAIDVAVDSDPLGMAIAATADRVAAPVPIANRAAHLAPAPGPPVARVAILDEHGNHLLDVPIAGPALSGPTPVREGAPLPAPPQPAAPPRLRRWSTWAIGATAFTVLGLGFGYAARVAQSDLDNAIFNSPQNFFEVAADARARRDRYTLLANISFAGGGLCAVTAIVMYATRPRAVVAPIAQPGGVGLAFATTW